MTVEARDLRPAAERRRGWLDAGGFVVALTALNIAYGLAHALGADPVAFITLAMLISLLSLAGIPPFAGFIGKLLVFGAAIQQGWVWLAITTSSSPP